MQKKLTISLDEQVYEGLQSVVGQENISRFIEDLVRPHVIAAGMSEPEAGRRTPEEEEAQLGDVSHEDWGKWRAANPDTVLSRAEMEAGYRAQAEEEARLGDTLYENENWEEWKEWYGANDSVSDDDADNEQYEAKSIKLVDAISEDGLTDESR